MPADILAVAVCRLEEVQLERVRLHQHHFKEILQQVRVTENLTLRSLNLSWNDISAVPSGLEALAKLREVHLRRTNLTWDHLESVLEGLRHGENLALLDVTLNQRLSIQPDQLHIAQTNIQTFLY